VAVVGGLWFLFLLLREIRAWWQPRPLTSHAAHAANSGLEPSLP
jgi:hypothetical protein